MQLFIVTLWVFKTMGNIKNISTAKSREEYTALAAVIAKKYPDYDIVVNGGAYRFYCVSYEVDKDNKTITLDYYIPRHINTKVCNRWVISEIEKGNTCGSAGLGYSKAIRCMTGISNDITKFDRILTEKEQMEVWERLYRDYDSTFTETDNGWELSFTKKEV